jgi:hypothetical protein
MIINQWMLVKVTWVWLGLALSLSLSLTHTHSISCPSWMLQTSPKPGAFQVSVLSYYHIRRHSVHETLTNSSARSGTPQNWSHINSGWEYRSRAYSADSHIPVTERTPGRKLKMRSVTFTGGTHRTTYEKRGYPLLFLTPCLSIRSPIMLSFSSALE